MLYNDYKENVMQIGVRVNLSKPKAIDAMMQIFKSLKSRSIACVFSKDITNEMPEIATSFPDAVFIDDITDGSDYLFIVGGDGTILSSAIAAAKKDIPILGINTGTVGFLTEYDVSQIDSACEDILKNNFSIENRMMIEAVIGDKRYIALNDVVASKGRNDTVLPIEVYVNGESVDRHYADGFLVSTATGSTAYSLSCGGPILEPSVKGLILIPICSHSLRSRPIVISELSTVRVSAGGKMLYPIIDGKPIDLAAVEILIQKSEYSVKLVKTAGTSFYQKLFTKLTRWGK